MNQSVIEKCINHIKDHLHLSYDKDLFIDFNAGQSCFIDNIIEMDLIQRSLFYDTQSGSGHPDIVYYDFLNPAFDFKKFDKTYLSGLWYDDVHVIGCPPVDQVERCIEVACKFAQSISFILPKKSQTLFPPTYIRLFSTDLIENSLVFQIWMKSDY